MWGAFEAPLLSLGHNATVADAFSVVLKNGAEIRKFGLDVNNGFRIIVKTTINKKEHKEILIDPKNTTKFLWKSVIKIKNVLDGTYLMCRNVVYITLKFDTFS